VTRDTAPVLEPPSLDEIRAARDRIAGVAVRTLDDLTFALRTRRPGDTIEVTYVRDGGERTTTATLEQRR